MNNYNDSKGYLLNFKAIGQRLAEVHIFKVETLDACIRPFANPVTIIMKHKLKLNIFICGMRTIIIRVVCL